MAERVGFEPTCRLRDKTLSRRPRYDHFGTSPCPVPQRGRLARLAAPCGTLIIQRTPAVRGRGSGAAVRVTSRASAAAGKSRKKTEAARQLRSRQAARVE